MIKMKQISSEKTKITSVSILPDEKLHNEVYIIEIQFAHTQHGVTY